MNHPTPHPTRVGAPPWRRALVWVVGLGLLAWLLHQVPLSTVRTAWLKPDALTWGVTLLGLGVSYLLRAARLQAVMGLASRDGPRWLGLRLDALRVILMHNAAVNLLPMRAGELSFPYLTSRVLHMPLSRSVAALLWMRLQDLAVLLALGLCCWPGLPWAWRLAGLTLIVAGWQAGVWVLARAWQGGQQPSASSRWRALLSKAHEALLEREHHHWSTWAFTWANWGIKLFAGAWLISAICGSGLGMAWAGALGGELAAVVPLQGPAGFGTYEAGVWAGLALGAAPSAPFMALAVPAALALHLCFLLCAVVAGALAWLTGSLAQGPDRPAPGIPD